MKRPILPRVPLDFRRWVEPPRWVGRPKWHHSVDFVVSWLLAAFLLIDYFFGSFELFLLLLDP
jgi:hypothetical protein